MVKQAVISQLASVGEAAFDKLPLSGTTRNAIQGAQQLKDRGEKLVHGLESVDERLAAIEKRLEALEKASKPVRTPTRARPAQGKQRASAVRPNPKA